MYCVLLRAHTNCQGAENISQHRGVCCTARTVGIDLLHTAGSHVEPCTAALLQVSRPSRSASYIIAAGSLLTEEPETAAAPASSTAYSSAEIAEAAAAAERALSSASASTSAAAGAKKGSSKWVIDEKENLKSTTEHRLVTYGCLSILGASIAGAAADIHSPGDVATVLGATFAAYVLSDLGTAVYHWAVDNYGDGNTPVFGRQIAAFQGHHQRPWTITQREFCNNVHQVCAYAAW